MNGSTFLLLLRLGLSLAVVLGLVWVAAKVLRGRGAMALRGPASHLEVLERRSVGKSASVAVVRVDGQALLLGVTESRVELLQACPSLDRSAETADDVVVIGAVDPTRTDAPAPAPAPAPAGLLSSTRRTGSMGRSAPRPPRMSLMDAMRELTVRRASASNPPR